MKALKNIGFYLLLPLGVVIFLIFVGIHIGVTLARDLWHGFTGAVVHRK